VTLTSSIVRTAGGLDIEVLRGGHGIKVVYLPDAEGSPDTGFADVLAQRFEVFAFVVPRSPNVHDMALVCDDVLDALGLTNVPVVGHGVGGMLAAELAAHSPRRVAKLALIAPEGLSAQRLYRIGAPTRLVWGQDDQVVPAQQATELAAGIASCDTAILAGAGHLVTDEQPDARWPPHQARRRPAVARGARHARERRAQRGQEPFRRLR
jgi:pimeloyl-ACP methyl ester carboxylesterase